MKQRERLAQGLLFTDMSEGLPQERLNAKKLVFDYNHLPPGEQTQRETLLRRLLGSLGVNAWLEPPFQCAYGANITIGDNFYANSGLTIVDDTRVDIGNSVLIGPNVTISTTGHPIDPTLRATGKMYAFPVTIEDDVWLGTGVILNPGVRIGRGSVVGAGSIVTKDIPAGVVALGNPCKVYRTIDERDRKYYFRDCPVTAQDWC